MVNYFQAITHKIEYIASSLTPIRYLLCTTDSYYCYKFCLYFISLFYIDKKCESIILNVDRNRVIIKYLNLMGYRNDYERFLKFNCHKNGFLLNDGLKHQYICPKTKVNKTIKSCYEVFDFAKTEKCFSNYSSSNFEWDMEFFTNFFKQLYDDIIDLACRDAVNYEFTYFYPDSHLDFDEL